ncbi:CtsR family transcriptional regulator [Shouchella clausii]|nr:MULTISPECIES: CtsR family transcriptional regulator [Shouchella]MCM3314822.1 CtsR family transcriptional regulator [Psychrobacillus sp. MER TA 17]PAD42195.1 CtsR family transcriptional regulator [Bacillus sp. 7520-S]SPU18593.1 transcriptional repressor of class III stress genes, CtsR [Niallia circulans]ALA52761.1 Transcriptional regulator CtsR [Shouchella clausii]AST95529.1 CtsR family transcriptional regulator [Shouchella clausii]
MRNISDLIEQYLKTTLMRSGNELLEIKRSELAKQFQCVPSQINYVISTRFTLEKGYIVESKRGGGGYIRITKVESHEDIALFEHMCQLIGNKIDQQTAQNIVFRLYEEEAITRREANLMMSALDRAHYKSTVAHRDEIRANVLKAMIETLKYKENET